MLKGPIQAVWGNLPITSRWVLGWWARDPLLRLAAPAVGGLTILVILMVVGCWVPLGSPIECDTVRPLVKYLVCFRLERKVMPQ